MDHLFSNLPNIMYMLFKKVSYMGYKAIIIVLFAIVARLLIKDMPKWIRYFLWMLVFIQLVLPVSISSPLSIYNFLPEKIVDVEVAHKAKQVDINENYGVDTNTEVTYIYEATDEDIDIVEQEISEVDHYYEDSTNYLPTEVVYNKNRSLAIITFVWIFGMISFIAYFIVSSIKLRKKLDEAVLLNDNVWLCDNVDFPFVLGIINPKIYLSSSMNDEHMEYVIMHENMHIHSKDQMRKYIAFFILMIYWMNPVIWIAYILFCRDIEFICDENVIKNLDSNARIAYTKALLACSTQKKKLNISPVAFGEIGIKNRVKNVLEYKKVPVWLNVIAIVIIIGLGASLITVKTLASPSEENENGQSIEYLPFEETENEQIEDFKPSVNGIDASESGFPYEITPENRIRTMGAAYAPYVYELDKSEQEYLINAIVSSVWTLIHENTMPHDGEAYIVYVFDETAPYKITFYSDGYVDIECKGEVCIYQVQGDAYQAASRFCANMPEMDKLIPCDIDKLTVESIWSYESRIVRDELPKNEILDYLASLPDEAELLYNEGCFVITNKGNCYGYSFLENFLEKCSNNIPSAIIIGQYTTEGDLILCYVAYDGNHVILTMDSRRDRFAGNGNRIYARSSQYFSTMELPGTDGNIMFLHDDPNMTPEKVEKVLASNSMEGVEPYGFYWIGSFILE